MARYDNILETIGRTPLVRLNKLAPPSVNVHVKLESFNPLGSVKDRMACAVIEDAEVRGLLRPGQTVVESTSGNTGIGLAMVCAHKGYPLVLTMAESFARRAGSQRTAPGAPAAASASSGASCCASSVRRWC